MRNGLKIESNQRRKTQTPILLFLKVQYTAFVQDSSIEIKAILLIEACHL